MTAWLTIIGIGEDGLLGLGTLAREVIDGAEFLFGGERHLALVGKKGLIWKSPLEDSFVELDQLQGKKVVVIATGDPMWVGIGATLGLRSSSRDCLERRWSRGNRGSRSSHGVVVTSYRGL